MKIEYKLKPITETSWILHHNGVRIAMVISSQSGYNMIGGADIAHKHFTDIDDMMNKLGCKITFEENEKITEPEVGDVYGYPIKHGSAHDTRLESSANNADYPSYSKTKGSDNRFAAGYYGVLFNHGWVASYCPKVSTIEDNIWIGPFRTRLEMLSAISSKKKEPKV